jgi:uncharacterized protein YndB with AHSA1/START domain
MKIRNNNPLDLEGADGEKITVEVHSVGTKHLVSYTLDGETASMPSDQPTSTLSFTLNKGKHDPSILTMLFTFSEQDGGNYDITVTGSGGGQTSHYSVTQFFGIPGDAISYTFDVT